jgi:hypothetical protein
MAYRDQSLPVNAGGTGNASLTAYSLICGGTTTTGALQEIAPVATGKVLVSGGTSALPLFTSNPTVGLLTIDTGITSVIDTAPLSGYIGYEIVSTVASGSAVTLTSTATPYNVTSISVAAGVYDVSAMVGFQSNTATSITQCVSAIGQTTASLSGTLVGNNRVDSTNIPNSTSDCVFSIPSWRFVTTSTVTLYLVAQGQWSGGTSMAAYGTIRAHKVT